MVDQSPQCFLLSHYADAAWDTLSAGFVAEKFGDAEQNLFHVDTVIKKHAHAGAESSADSARVFEGKPRVEFFRRNKRARRASEQHSLKASVAGDAACHLNQFAQRGSHRNFIDPRTNNMSAQAK